MQKKNLQKKLIKKPIRRFKNVTSFNFVVIYTIHKMLALLKNHLKHLKDNIFECFFKEHNRLLTIFNKTIFL